MLSLLRWWDAYWLSQGFVTGRESQGTWLVVTYSNAVYYTLIIIGVLSMLTIRKYVEELTNCEKTKKDIIANLEFRKIAAKAIGATGDPVIRANLRDVKQRATDLCEGLRAKDELELSEIYPLFIGSRKKLAAQLRRELEPDWKEQNNRIASAMFEHKRVATDGLPLEAARANAIIWNQNICMPTDKESVAKGYDMMIDSETGKSLNKMLITAYHERLASNYDMKVDQIVGQKFLFSNRMLPIIWPQACKWPYPRDPDNEMDPNEKYGLGEGQGCKKYCKPPFRVFIGGPVIKNYLLLSRVGKWLMAPMNALNIWVMKMQYSTRSMGQMFGDAIARSKTLSKFRGVGAKVMAAQAIASDIGQAAAFVTAVGEANGAGPLPSASDIEAATKKDAEAAEKAEETPAEETPVADTVTDITDVPEAPAAEAEAPAPAPKVEL